MEQQGAAGAIPLELSLRGALPSIGWDVRLKGHEHEHDGNARGVDGGEGDETWCHGERLKDAHSRCVRADTLSRTHENKTTPF